MTADTKMAGSGTSSSDVVDASKDSVVTAKTTEASLPPLVLAALRLEKILHDHDESSGANYNSSRANGINFEAYYMNPIKVVRRWLGTSSGATSTTSIDDGTKGTGITVEDIQMATKLLLDPNMECTQMGRSLLLSKDLLSVVKPDVMDTEKDNGGGGSSDMDMATEEVGNETKPNNYVTIASAREVECWLFSLMIRTLWKQQQQQQPPASSSAQLIQDTMTLANDALLISTAHFSNDHHPTKESIATTPSIKSSMYPLIARLYRFAALAYESYSSNSSNNNMISSNDMLSTMSKAHTLATVRRDVDTQATILNIMLRELLRHAQGTIHRMWIL
jgi:hypothetical protein